MSETKWEVGGDITGGNVPTQYEHGPFCGRDWPYTVVREGEQVVAVVPAAYDPAVPRGVPSQPIKGTEKARAHLIAAAPKLLDVVHGLCIQLASAGVEAKADSLNPIAALHAKALAAHEAATGDGNPFATALAGICADNRAALARGESPSPDATTEVKP